MSVWDRIARWFAPDRSDPDGEGSGEDVAADPATASNRATGGDHVELSGDRGSVTGTGRSEVFVGRIAGDDAGYAGETGAERRAQAAQEDAAAVDATDDAPAVAPEARPRHARD